MYDIVTERYEQQRAMLDEAEKKFKELLQSRPQTTMTCTSRCTAGFKALEDDELVQECLQICEQINAGKDYPLSYSEFCGAFFTVSDELQFITYVGEPFRPTMMV